MTSVLDLDATLRAKAFQGLSVEPQRLSDYTEADRKRGLAAAVRVGEAYLREFDAVITYWERNR